MDKATFNLPNSNNGLIQAGDIPCKGNGMTLGLTNGTNNGGLASGSQNDFMPYTNLYGANVGTSISGSFAFSQKGTGITTDPTKSGIIADTSSLTLICNMIIKY